MITISLSGQQKVLSNLAKIYRIQRIVDLWLKSGEPDEIMQESFKENFESEGRPSWMRLSDSTIDSRERMGFGDGPILHRTGNLMDEITTIKGTNTSSSRMSTKSWGIDQIRSSEKLKFAVHQLGKGKSGQNLPQRKMIGFQQADTNSLKKSLSNWLWSQLK